MTFPRLALAALAVALLAACQTVPQKDAPPAGEPVAEAPAAAPAGPAAHDNLNAVAWQQTSTEYRLNAIQTWRAATAQLDRALKTPQWDALTKEDRDTPADGKPPAVIVDVDETMLDNSPYQARLIRDGKNFDEFTWAEWVNEKAAPAVPGALEFAQAAAAKGITVFYISNRADDLRDATVENLRKAGFPVADPQQFLGLGAFVENCEQIGSEKTCRRRHVGRSYRVLVQAGDQIVDMVAVLANTPAGRLQAVEPYMDWVGERWFVLPNPTYGGWEPALFNNEWGQPEEERRKQKLDALRY